MDIALYRIQYLTITYKKGGSFQHDMLRQPPKMPMCKAIALPSELLLHMVLHYVI